MTDFVALPAPHRLLSIPHGSLVELQRGTHRRLCFPSGLGKTALLMWGKVAVPDLKNYGQPVVDLETLSPNV